MRCSTFSVIRLLPYSLLSLSTEIRDLAEIVGLLYEILQYYDKACTPIPGIGSLLLGLGVNFFFTSLDSRYELWNRVYSSVIIF